MEQAASEKAASEASAALAKEKEKNSAILAVIKVSSSTLSNCMCQGGTEFATQKCHGSVIFFFMSSAVMHCARFG